MSEHTITIPADLWGSIGATPTNLRNYAKSLTGERTDPRSTNCSHAAGRMLLERLADEIERQAPRPEGWYHVEDGAERVLFWDGEDDWHYGPGSCGAYISPNATITPVTIGGAS